MRIFVAGATGATGAVFVPLAERRGHSLILHVRPQTAARHPLGSDPRSRVFDLADSASLAAAVRGCDAIVSLVGTMRARFSTGDTYESSDIGTTRMLVAAARAERVRRFLLLSSYGAEGMGAYLKMKGECERIVREAPDLLWTIVRPSALVSPGQGGEGTHGKREVPRAAMAFGKAIRAIPGLAGWADDWRPIPIEVVVRAMLTALEGNEARRILAGRDLWVMGEV